MPLKFKQTYRPNVRRKTVLQECIDAMEGIVVIEHTIAGCRVAECTVCRDREQRLNALHQAITRAKKSTEIVQPE